MVNNKELKILFKELKENKEIAFSKFYEKSNKLIFGVAFSICRNNSDSEDVVHNVLLKIYNMDKEKLPTTNETSWLYTVAKNETITLLRKRKDDVDIDSLYNLENGSNDFEEIISKDAFERLTSGLNEKEKEIMSLKVLAGLSFDEIGKMVNEPVGTVKWRYYKSVNSLKVCLSNLAMSLVSFIFGRQLLKENIKKDANYEESTKSEIKSGINFDINSFDFSQETDDLTTTAMESKPIVAEYGGEFLLGISSVTLIVAIIFAIFFKKYQLKCKIKPSK